MNPMESRKVLPRTKRSACVVRRGYIQLAFLLALLFPPAMALAIPQLNLNPGDPIPPRELTTIDGTQIKTTGSQAKVRVFFFAQSNHEPTAKACRYIQDALNNPLLEGERIDWIVILSKHSDPEQARACSIAGKVLPEIVLDTDRALFGAFHIIVVPSVVIADANDRVVYAVSGMTPRFGDLVGDAILLAAGKIKKSDFERTLHPDADSPTSDRAKAGRIFKLAQQAAGQGMYDLAYAQYIHAIKVDPSFIEAHLAIGYLLRKQMKLDKAEETFQGVLETNPDSIDARLGIAWVLLLRGGENIDQAESIVTNAIAKHPDSPLVHYIQGLIYEKKSDPERAATCFKRAVKLEFNKTDPRLLIDD
jgi:tetratricopeptide (TPR) repeat protein